MIPFDTDAFTLNWASGTERTVTAVPGFGFRITPDPRNPGAYPLKVWVRGEENKGKGLLYVTGPDWHEGHFQSLSVESLGVVPGGDWFINRAVAPAARIFGSANNAGAIPLVSADEVQALTRAAPVANEGILINGKSSYFLFFESPDDVQTITGGAGDVWRKDGLTGLWELVLSIPLPVGNVNAALPLDDLKLATGAADRLLLAANGVALSGAGATVTAHMRAR